ncbi:long-chain-fatty-acid--CoA ligase [Aquabacterium sp.]|uniref:long-chain-fatty-acid--CoA ligase n=1 Tax=Aquabacterium sp. TaxID=1872578 RepID=UPI002C0954F9|nr:long-chain-fatty-acid--CoA ligase [Aquabacterium sp.]HSW08947.1 long-chain-fatty-acid--CoA ligase [Aquabacterium sp.]
MSTPALQPSAKPTPERITAPTPEPFWPDGLPRTLEPPQRTLFGNLAAAAVRAPERTAIVFCDTPLRYDTLLRQVEQLAGWLQQRCGVQRGDRVLLFSQNCPQFTVAYYAVLRADAVVVPVNAMSTAAELAYFADDSGARVAIVGAELAERAVTLLAADGPHGGPHSGPHSGRLDHVIAHRYADAVAPDVLAGDAGTVPDWVRRSADITLPSGVTDWRSALAAALPPAPAQATPDDLCLLPYTSGTTGQPKGCRHSHRTVMHSIAAARRWRSLPEGCVVLAVAPMFHLLGMQNGMNLPMLLAGTVVMQPRWDRTAAAALIERYRVVFWAAPPTMVVDFFSQAGLDGHDLSSLKMLVGGGAAMPEAVSALLRERYRIDYNEAYGLTETASFLHCNPVGRGKACCLGVPTFEVDSRIIDPVTHAPVAAGEVGELITCAPQVMLGYWQRPEADALAFLMIDGKRFFRTGDLCSVDDEGYFFMRDRLKRMINVSGFKVWPAEVENLLYAHPGVHEACVIATPDARGGEAVKAVVVLKPEVRGQLSEAELIAWARTQMAVYKAPRQVQFVAQLPKSGTGKIAWRTLQDAEFAAP